MHDVIVFGENLGDIFTKKIECFDEVKYQPNQKIFPFCKIGKLQCTNCERFYNQNIDYYIEIFS